MIQALETERATPLETVERWCGAHGGRLAQIASEQTRNGELVRDALQEVWLGLCTLGPPDEVAADPQRLFAWLLIAVRRRVVDLLRRERLRSHRSLDEAADFAKDTPTEAARRESGERVRSVMDSLAANCEGDARLLELLYFDDRSVAQIAELLGLTPRAVSARLQRAKRKFRDAWRGG